MKLELHNTADNIAKIILDIEESFENLDFLNLKEFSPDNTAIVFVDIVEGFVNVGTLSSPRAKSILSSVKTLNENSENFHKIYFADTHEEDAVEFETYPPHCIENTIESQLVEELIVDENDKKSLLIKKNSTNGYITPEFQKWLHENPQVNNFIITGLVTDICVMQFALNLKTAFNQENKKSNLFVPIESVETFHIDETNHHAGLMNLFALYNMRMNGIEIITFEK